MTTGQKETKHRELTQVWQLFKIYGETGYGSGLSATPNQNQQPQHPVKDLPQKTLA